MSNLLQLPHQLQYKKSVVKFHHAVSVVTGIWYGKIIVK